MLAVARAVACVSRRRCGEAIGGEMQKMNRIAVVSTLLATIVLSGCDAPEITAAHEAAKGHMNDPASAQFRNEQTNVQGATKVVCGEVNGKNSYGGYSGFSRYVYDGKNAYVSPGDPGFANYYRNAVNGNGNIQPVVQACMFIAIWTYRCSAEQSRQLATLQRQCNLLSKNTLESSAALAKEYGIDIYHP
jgi:hypothetical protein